MRFNQLHNGTDLDLGDEQAAIIGGLAGVSGFVTVEPARIAGNSRASGAGIRAEIMKLMARFGPWGACVAGEDGRVFHAAQYALACKILYKPLLVYVVPKESEPEARELLAAQYGVFSYDGLPREAYIQTFAQMYRLRGGARDNESPTYTLHVIPWLKANPGARVLDFGCGQGDYVRALGKLGHAIQGMELFRRKPGQDAIDVAAVNGMVDALIRTLKTHGRFDAVVCDYVLNSVDSVQAEDDVLTCLAALCKPGGMVFFSGRRKERLEAAARYSGLVQKGNTSRYTEFLDEHGLTALYRKGRWFYQKFHSADDINAICRRMGWKLLRKTTPRDTAFQCAAANHWQPDMPKVTDSIRREFNMQLGSSGRRLGRHGDVLEALLCLL